MELEYSKKKQGKVVPWNKNTVKELGEKGNKKAKYSIACFAITLKGNIIDET
jgi:hypothetical protein